MLIIICGLPGSGKSSLAKKLKRKLSAVYLNSDVIRKQIFSPPTYTEEEKRQVYMEMVNQTEKLLNGKRNVIVDATFYTKRYRGMMVEAARDAGTRHYIIRCTLPEELIISRLKERGKGRSMSDADYDVYLKLKGRFEPIEGRYLELDCSLPATEQMTKVMDFIGEKK